MEKIRDVFKIGQKFNVDIENVNGHGEGIAKIEKFGKQFLVFVPGAEIGHCKIEITHIYNTYLYGKKV
ncbi:TRAM domain-containing protein [Candidatus Micrarchaeota archaeon]|jgi:predicted RNA-binding protein with TRAM domain|nr:TRAM domain-containing protein [Candidatus Micrarchaeota archaeon]